VLFRLAIVCPIVIAAVGCGAEGRSTTQPSRAKAYEFRGTCNWARPMGHLSRYRLRLRVKGSAGATALVHSTAYIHRGDRSNRIGVLGAGAVLPGEGPLHFGRVEGGTSVAYAVAVRDVEGKTCRGYVDAVDVEVIGDAARRQSAGSPTHVPGSGP
jgi:hypothetical protein